MKVTKDTKWKYLRENSAHYFDADRNTTLKEYLSAIFPSNQFVYDARMKKDEVINRCPSADYRRYRPDSRCDELNLIVEFDGVDHYQNTLVVMKDAERDNWFESLGYTTVRIPYWIQLSNTMISHLFGVHMNEPMCQLDESFCDTINKDNGLSISVGNMCEAGRYRFIREVTSYPMTEQKKVFQDLSNCVKLNKVPSEYIFPTSVKKMWEKQLRLRLKSNSLIEDILK